MGMLGNESMFEKTLLQNSSTPSKEIRRVPRGDRKAPWVLQKRYDRKRNQAKKLCRKTVQVTRRKSEGVQRATGKPSGCYIKRQARKRNQVETKQNPHPFCLDEQAATIPPALRATSLYTREAYILVSGSGKRGVSHTGGDRKALWLLHKKTSQKGKESRNKKLILPAWMSKQQQSLRHSVPPPFTQGRPIFWHPA